MKTEHPDAAGFSELVPFGEVVVISPAGQSRATFIVLDDLDEFPQLGQFFIRVLHGLYRLYVLFFHREDLLSDWKLSLLLELYIIIYRSRLFVNIRLEYTRIFCYLAGYLSFGE